MSKYILKRLLQLIPVVFGVTLIVFTLLYITPGDPVKIMMGEQVDPIVLEQKRQELGLNDPYIIQFLNYLKNVFLNFDLGNSYATQRPVLEEILSSAPNTLILTFVSMIVATTGGIIFGIIAAVQQYKWIDTTITIVALVGISLPLFWSALLMILLFSVKLGILPSSGFNSWKSMIMPCLALAMQSIAVIARMTRSSMLEVIRQDYIKTAKAKGLSSWAIIAYHEVKNALIPIITVIGMDFGSLLGGAVVCETIFSIQGIGRLMIDSIKRRDYPVVQGTVLFIAITCCLVNLIVDLLYMQVDPRIKKDKNS